MSSRFGHWVFLGLLLTSTGCQQQSEPKGQGNAAPEAKKNTANEKPADAVFVVVKPDGQKKPFTMQDLKNLPLSTIFADGNPQEGPSLPAVLKAVNADEYQFVVITGREGARKLPKAEITDQLILDFNNRGSVKLVSPTMPHDERIRDITRIEIQ